MARKIAQTTLNASTLDILNVIRANASYDYQQSVPEVTKSTDIPKVGEVIYGTPAFANQFINALVNRIATVRVQSATFNNPYSILKKGYIEFGESIEDIFVGIAKAVDFSVEKAPKREFKRTIPDVKSVFHTMNWRVMYPITIQDDDLKLAFLSINGVTDLIAKIVEQVYTASEYDEFLLFKYLLIKAISHGKIKPQGINITGNDLSDSAVKFRGISNLLPFMSSNYNEYAVKTNTPKERQVIFMDATFNAQFDVNVLASAFNMDKADFMGRMFLIDNWTEFDNERFDIIRENSDGIEEVTEAELLLLNDVKAVILDENWFQIYDNNNKMTEKYVSSGLYWNYFYHVWKTVSYSPFANAVVFVNENAVPVTPQTFDALVRSVDVSNDATVISFSVDDSTTALTPTSVIYEQTKELAEKFIGVQKYGAILVPSNGVDEVIRLSATINGVEYVSETITPSETQIDDSIAFTKK